MVSEKDYKILIVDDHIQTAVYLSNMLEYEGFKTFQAYDRDDAVKLVHEQKPDLILLDLALHKTTGFEVAKQLPQEKIMLMTGYNLEAGTISKFKNIVEIMPKPIDILVLKEKIRNVLRLPKKKEI